MVLFSSSRFSFPSRVILLASLFPWGHCSSLVDPPTAGLNDLPDANVSLVREGRASSPPRLHSVPRTYKSPDGDALDVLDPKNGLFQIRRQSFRQTQWSGATRLEREMAPIALKAALLKRFAPGTALRDLWEEVGGWIF